MKRGTSWRAPRKQPDEPDFVHAYRAQSSVRQSDACKWPVPGRGLIPAVWVGAAALALLVPGKRSARVVAIAPAGDGLTTEAVAA